MQNAKTPPRVVDEVTTLGVMLTLVGMPVTASPPIASQVQTLYSVRTSRSSPAGTPPMLSTHRCAARRTHEAREAVQAKVVKTGPYRPMMSRALRTQLTAYPLQPVVCQWKAVPG